MAHSQGDLAGAVKSYRDGLAITERLTQAGNTGWQHGLAVGDVYRRSGGRAHASAALRRASDHDRLAKLPPDNDVWKRDLAWFNEKIAAQEK